MATNGKLEWPTKEQVEEQILVHGVSYTSSFWKTLQIQEKLVLTVEQAEIYHIVQKAHVELTGHSLPDTIKGSMKTRAQIRNEIGEVDETKIENAVQSGMMAKLAKLRGENK
jgi:hypothetical protein